MNILTKANRNKTCECYRKRPSFTVFWNSVTLVRFPKVLTKPRNLAMSLALKLFLVDKQKRHFLHIFFRPLSLCFQCLSICIFQSKYIMSLLSENNDCEDVNIIIIIIIRIYPKESSTSRNSRLYNKHWLLNQIVKTAQSLLLFKRYHELENRWLWFIVSSYASDYFMIK